MKIQIDCKHAFFVLIVGAAATAMAANPDVCSTTSTDALNSCKKGAQSSYWQSVGMCANLTEQQARQACVQTAQSTYQVRRDILQ